MPQARNALGCHCGISRLLSEHCNMQVQARGPPAEDDPTIAGHLLRLRDQKGQPLSDDRLHAEFSAMFIGGMAASA